MRDRSARTTLEEVLRDLTIRVERQERHTHNTSGRRTPSDDPNNAARLGSDGMIYAHKIAYQPTPPTADDFASPTIPFGSIWVGSSADVGPTSLGLVRAWNGTHWTERCPAWGYLPQGWVQATAVHTWDGYRWVDPP